ncbi:MAG: zinc transporter ZntB [Dongiaceae bacterium]
MAPAEGKDGAAGGGSLPPADEDGLVYAFILDGKGGGRAIGWDGVDGWRPEAGTLWLHIDRTAAAAQRWLYDRSAIDSVMVEALLQGNRRPRVLAVGEEVMVYLRGVNLNPGADPDDMIGIALWVGQGRLISVRHRRIMAAADLREAIEHGRGPGDAGGLLVYLAERLMERMGPVIVELDDQVDALQDDVLTGGAAELRSRLGHLRREAIALRRYLAPQREVMARLPQEQVPWLTQRYRNELREVADRTARMVEDLDSARDRAAVTQDELNSRISDQMNRTMYLLTVVSAVLLPPSFLTGLFGVNLGGLPGTDTPLAFAAFLAAILGLAAFELWLLRRLKWI